MVTRKLALEGSFPLLDRGFLYWVLRGCWRISVFRQGVCVCVCMCVSVCVCVNANAREEHPSLLLLFWTVIRMNGPSAGECLNVYSVIGCLCLCVRMYHGRSSISAFKMESKGLSKCHVEFCQCELQMRVRQVGFDQGSCDVVGAMCVCVCACVCVCVSVRVCVCA